MEIRPRVVEYVADRIEKLQAKSPSEGVNLSVLQVNAMKYLPNYFVKGQLSKIFFLFPDPHFKKKVHRRRIISPTLLAEYAYALRVGGIIYTVTDVKDLFDWEYKCLNEHPLFVELTKEETDNDPVVPLVMNSSEEAKKVEKIDGEKYFTAFRRIAPPV
eukprot:CAMPEP_0168514972 /NCGR_PEP_ID=MMETSP0405-20121227/4442_1 /TAXON_ID=498012 /ORGANISM="Trichosphaerium sp, Strain Am-I-7 wt" /LENGTH=158 /DNA_ID=CAMNT_0008534229 /DNA_START=227 /DNA_END=703 /DNA_ORIENTATION=-